MKVCYVDDSGNPSQDRIFVMVGIVADTTRLHKTDVEFNKFLKDVRSVFPENLKELKGSRILYGKGAWRQVDAAKRKQIFTDLSVWLDSRKHDIIVSAIDVEKVKQSGNIHNTVPKEIASELWVAVGLNIALQIQARNQGEDKNKGNTFLFIDDNAQKLPLLCELLWEPPAWIDGFYPRKKKEERLNQIIDTAFAVQSHHCSLVQVADLLAFVVRRHFELQNQIDKPEWKEEPDFIKECLRQIAPRIYRDSGSMKSTNASQSATWYRAIAPDGYDKLLKGEVE